MVIGLRVKLGGSIPLVQFADDLEEMKPAKQVAFKAARAGIDLLEVGTPLIKRHGVDVVRRFKNWFPTKPIVADMKTIDMGEVEVKMAARAGASAVMISGTAPDSTVLAAVSEAKKRNLTTMASLIGVKDIESRSIELEGMHVDVIVAHAGIDEQVQGITPFEDFRVVRSKIRVPLAISGGINLSNISKVIRLKPQLIIIGRGIYRDSDPLGTAKKIMAAVHSR
jgi:3-hexulose-6-phosphate synthase/6-phospho-3-hexuloisomerase